MDDNPYGNNNNSNNYINNLNHTSASNIASALGSITASNYGSTQSKAGAQINSQAHLGGQTQLLNQVSGNAYGGDSHYSSANYSSTKSPKPAVNGPTTKQNFFNIPTGSKDRLEPKPTTTSKLTTGLGGDTGVKKYVPFAASNQTSSVSKLQAPTMGTSSSKGVKII